jgi:hypothetical protein
MAYRELPHPAACHPTLPTAMACAGCATPTCESCLRFDGAVARCRRCAERARGRRRWRRAGVSFGVLSLVAAASLHAARSWSLSRETKRIPCFGMYAARETAEQLATRNEPAAALEYAEAYLAQCPLPIERAMLPARYLAHRALGQLEDAVADATAALDGAPHDDFLRLWHIAALEEAGHFVAAAAEEAALADDVAARQPTRRRFDAPRGSGGFDALPTRIAWFFGSRGWVCDGAFAEKGFMAWFSTGGEDAEHWREILYRPCPLDGTHVEPATLP